MQNFKEIRSMLFVVAAAGMWSIVYPELVYHPDVVRAVDESSGIAIENVENGTAVEDPDREKENSIAKKTEDAGNIYEQLLEADREQIRLKSKVWEMWIKWRKQR